MAYPPFFDIRNGRLTETLAECAREVADAELYDAGEVRNADAEGTLRLDVGDNTFRLPGGETAPRGRLVPRILLPYRADSQ